jgi:hypothetical protein
MQGSNLKEMLVTLHLTAASASVSEGAHVRAQRAKCYGICEMRSAKSQYFVVSHSRVYQMFHIPIL